MAMRRKRKTDAEATVAPEVPGAENPAATATPAVEPTPAVESHTEADRPRVIPTHDDEW